METLSQILTFTARFIGTQIAEPKPGLFFYIWRRIVTHDRRTANLLT